MEFNQLRLEKAKLECQIRRNQQLNELLVRINYQLEEYDDELIRKIINKIVVLDVEKTEILFKTGSVVNVNTIMK